MTQAERYRERSRKLQAVDLGVVVERFGIASVACAFAACASYVVLAACAAFVENDMGCNRRWQQKQKQRQRAFASSLAEIASEGSEETSLVVKQRHALDGMESVVVQLKAEAENMAGQNAVVAFFSLSLSLFQRISISKSILVPSMAANPAIAEPPFDPGPDEEKV